MEYIIQTAEGFDTVYGLGHDVATKIYQASVLQGAPLIYQTQVILDATSLLAALQYREERQESVPNFTDDDLRFDVAWAAGYVVATLAEQDAYLSCPESYRADLQLRFAPQLPVARVVEAD